MAETARVEDRHTISLNGTYFRLKQPVRRFITSQWPAKLSLGEHGPESHPLTSTVTHSDHRGGIGIHMLDPSSDMDRSWWSTCQLRFNRHLVLPRKVTETAAATASNVGVIGDMGSKVYASFGLHMHKYNGDTDSWGSSLVTLAGSATDIATGLVGGTTYMIVPNGTDVDYSDTADSWAQNTTQGIRNVAFFRDKLWGIKEDGQLYWTDGMVADAGAMWTASARLQTEDGYVSDLFTGPGVDGEEALYIGTKVGLAVVDLPNDRVLWTSLVTPYHPRGGEGCTVWRGAIYFPAGIAVYKFLPGTQQTIITIMGPDRDDGLPEDRRGAIRHMAPSHTDLLASIDGNVAYRALLSMENMTVGSHHGAATFATVTSYSSVLGYDDLGWEVKWAGGGSSTPATAIHVAYAYGDYRMWWGYGQRVYWMTMPMDIENPNQVSDMDFGDAGTWEGPWLGKGTTHETWTALGIYLQSTHNDTNDQVILKYGKDLATTWTTLATKKVSGDQLYTFNDTAGNAAGMEFENLRMGLDFSHDTGESKQTPDVVKVAFAFKKNLDVSFGWDLHVVIKETVYGLSPAEQWEKLDTILATNTLMPYTCRDDANALRNYRVAVTNAQTVEQTGHDQTGELMLQVSEAM